MPQAEAYPQAERPFWSAWPGARAVRPGVVAPRKVGALESAAQRVAQRATRPVSSQAVALRRSPQGEVRLAKSFQIQVRRTGALPAEPFQKQVQQPWAASVVRPVAERLLALAKRRVNERRSNRRIYCLRGAPFGTGSKRLPRRGAKERRIPGRKPLDEQSVA